MKGFRWIQGILLLLLLTLFWAMPAAAQTTEGRKIWQTGASGNTVSLSWQKTEGIVLYKLYYKVASEPAYHYLKDVYASKGEPALDAELPESGKFYQIKVESYDEHGQAGEVFYMEDCRTAPGKTALRNQRSYPTSRTMKIYWNTQESADGYEFRVTNLSGELVGRYLAEDKTSITLEDIFAGEFYRLRIRGYFRNDEKMIYGDAAYLYIAQQPRVKFKWASRSAVKVSWPETTGATSYSVYISGDPLGGFRKVKTVQERTAIIPGLVRNRKYYVYTVANMRKGKQVYTSPKTNRYSFRLQAD